MAEETCVLGKGKQCAWQKRPAYKKRPNAAAKEVSALSQNPSIDTVANMEKETYAHGKSIDCGAM